MRLITRWSCKPNLPLPEVVRCQCALEFGGAIIFASWKPGILPVGSRDGSRDGFMPCVPAAGRTCELGRRLNWARTRTAGVRRDGSF